MPLKIGQKAPNFTLPSTSGSEFTLHIDCFEKPCILYFYPKNFTRVCTAEACDFRDSFEVFRELSIPVIGISRDDIASHLRFKKAYNLPFELLSDASGRVCKAYDALIPVVKIPKRVTYFLDQKHRIKGVHADMLESKMHIEAMINML